MVTLTSKNRTRWAERNSIGRVVAAILIANISRRWNIAFVQHSSCLHWRILVKNVPYLPAIRTFIAWQYLVFHSTPFVPEDSRFVRYERIFAYELFLHSILESRSDIVCYSSCVVTRIQLKTWYFIKVSEVLLSSWCFSSWKHGTLFKPGEKVFKF